MENGDGCYGKNIQTELHQPDALFIADFLVGRDIVAGEPVHWFKATSDLAFTFNLAVYDVDSAEQFSGRQFYLDPMGGEKLGDGSLRVRHLTSQESRRLYGKS